MERDEARIELDSRGIITGWSDGAEQLFGWRCGEAIGKASHVLIPSRNRARYDRSILPLFTADG